MPTQPGTYSTNLFPNQIQWKDGFSWCPDVPGLGVDIDMDEVEKSYIDPRSWPPRLRREDGAFTNW